MANKIDWDTSKNFNITVTVLPPIPKNNDIFNNHFIKFLKDNKINNVFYYLNSFDANWEKHYKTQLDWYDYYHDYFKYIFTDIAIWPVYIDNSFSDGVHFMGNEPWDVFARKWSFALSEGPTETEKTLYKYYNDYAIPLGWPEDVFKQNYLIIPPEDWCPDNIEEFLANYRNEIYWKAYEAMQQSDDLKSYIQYCIRLKKFLRTMEKQGIDWKDPENNDKLKDNYSKYYDWYFKEMGNSDFYHEREKETTQAIENMTFDELYDYHMHRSDWHDFCQISHEYDHLEEAIYYNWPKWVPKSEFSDEEIKNWSNWYEPMTISRVEWTYKNALIHGMEDRFDEWCAVQRWGNGVRVDKVLELIGKEDLAPSAFDENNKWKNKYKFEMRPRKISLQEYEEVDGKEILLSDQPRKRWLEKHRSCIQMEDEFDFTDKLDELIVMDSPEIGNGPFSILPGAKCTQNPR